MTVGPAHPADAVTAAFEARGLGPARVRERLPVPLLKQTIRKQTKKTIRKNNPAPLLRRLN